jgi:hypothetical protein
VTGTSAPYTLEQSRDGGAHFARWSRRSSARRQRYRVLGGPFHYVQHAGVVDQVTIDLTFQTNTSTVDLVSDVQLRNAES